jgi:hypothetical protein
MRHHSVQAAVEELTHLPIVCTLSAEGLRARKQGPFGGRF